MGTVPRKTIREWLGGQVLKLQVQDDEIGMKSAGKFQPFFHFAHGQSPHPVAFQHGL
jgi:hypothetical protein